MEIILASTNKGKIKEIENFLDGIKTIPYTDLIDTIDIEENGSTFKENAIIKAKKISEKISEKNDFIILADDSGISVPVLDNKPGIYSARFAGKNATDKENIKKLIDELKQKNIKKTSAFYTAAIALATKSGIFTVHGWMYGEIIDEPRGQGGFGYDPMFIPLGYDKTLGELDPKIKKNISHRTNALKLAKILINSMKG